MLSCFRITLIILSISHVGTSAENMSSSPKHVGSDFGYLGLECSQIYSGSCCSLNEFQCNDGSCIPLTSVCDSRTFSVELHRSVDSTLKTDCSDGSDEYGCSKLPCSARRPACDQRCSDIPGNRSLCTCHAGYSITTSSLQNNVCVDVDECALETHKCSHECVNLISSYLCSCKRGFRRDPDGDPGSCRAEDGNILILFNSESWIFGYDFENNVTERLVPSGPVDSFDYDPASDEIYSLNIHKQSVTRSRFNFPGKIPSSDAGGRNLTSEGVEKLCFSKHKNSDVKKMISVDWSVGNLYWVSNVGTRSVIMVSRVDGSAIKTVVENSRGVITSFVLDPVPGDIYWTSVGHRSEIRTSELSGRSVNTFVSLAGHHPECLTLDHGLGRLYWLERTTSTIYAMYKNGERPTKLKKLSLDLVPRSMDAFGSHLYWVTKESGLLVRLDKFGRGRADVLIDNLVEPKTVKVYHSKKYLHDHMSWKNVRNRCKHCHGLCMRLPHGTRCYPVGFSSSHRVAKVCREDRLCNLSQQCNSSAEQAVAQNYPIRHLHQSAGIVVTFGFAAVSSLIVIGSCFAYSCSKQRTNGLRSKFIQMQEIGCCSK